MIIRTFPMGPLQANLYVVLFGSDAFIIDPCVPYEALGLEGVKVRGIFCTHAHFDHITEAENIRIRTGSALFAYETECAAILNQHELGFGKAFSAGRISPPVRALKDEEVLTPEDFGSEEPDDISITVLHTPGHSSGSMCLLFTEKTKSGINRYLFSGDTVFAGTVGRTDLGGSIQDMMRSIRKISDLPDDVCIFPGHGPATTLHEEKHSNPYFTARNDNDII